AVLLQEHGMVENLAAFEQAQHREGIGALRDLVLTGLEAAGFALGEGEEGEAEGAPDDVRLVESPRDIEHAQMSGDLDDTGAGRHGGSSSDEPPDLQPEEEREQADDAPREMAWADPGDLSERSSAVGSGVGRALEKPSPFNHDSLQFCPAPPDESNLSGVVGPPGPFWYTRTARVLSPANSPRRSLMPQLVL